VEYVNTSLNSADCLTKSLCERLHRLHTFTLCGLDWDADCDFEYQQELTEDQRSGDFESRKAMLDLEPQSELEDRRERPEGSTNAPRSGDNSGSDGIQTNRSAEKTEPFVDAGSDVLLSKYLVGKKATEAKRK
jgi:hypothetical protein